MAVDLVVPGDPSTPTGGYIYDRQILAGLAELGWRTAVHSLDGSFPRPTPRALRAARARFAAIPDGRTVLIDGLALAGLDRVLESEARRLRLVALIHHPLALETGIDAATARLLETAERSALAQVERVIVTSHWTARTLGSYGVTPERLRVVEPGVDRRRPAASRGTEAASRSPAPRVPSTGRAPRESEVSMLCVATLTQRKGHAVLFEALGELRDRRWHLACAGSTTRDAATTAALEHQIDRLSLGKRISLLGDLDHETLERYYARADLFVLASYLEGFGMALAEAIARGVPVVSTRAGAIPETVPAAAGVLVPPGDSRALAKALARLLDEPAELAALTARARAAAASMPTWQGAAKKFAAALDGVGTRAA
ncbi:MAG TPA: glycosyltransferase family 4 protein [Gammaproteobacteria bacterium]|nr:glycosyltransferase family 4 protein [Gammaproteobacteria bacterium]